MRGLPARRDSSGVDRANADWALGMAIDSEEEDRATSCASKRIARATVGGPVVSNHRLFHGPAETSYGLPRAKSIWWSALSPEQARGIDRLPNCSKSPSGSASHGLKRHRITSYGNTGSGQ